MPQSKCEKIKPHLIECIDRLRRLIELDAPVCIIGAAAWNVFQTTLATYGDGAGSTMVQSIRERNLHNRGMCSHEDCTAYVERPCVGICEEHLKALGLEDCDEVLD